MKYETNETTPNEQSRLHKPSSPQVAPTESPAVPAPEAGPYHPVKSKLGVAVEPVEEADHHAFFTICDGYIEYRTSKGHSGSSPLCGNTVSQEIAELVDTFEITSYDFTRK